MFNKKLYLVSLILFLSSCAIFNSKKREILIESTPNGADIIIDDKKYGETPLILNVKLEKQKVILRKSNVGESSFLLEIDKNKTPTLVNGKPTFGGIVCTTVPLELGHPIILIMYLAIKGIDLSIVHFTNQCADFKTKKYNITIETNKINNDVAIP